MLPNSLSDSYFPVGILLSSNLALNDAKRGLSNLESSIKDKNHLLSEWKVQWVGICAILRASIHLFTHDAKSCRNQALCNSLRLEWQQIKQQKEEHSIYWEFINKERNSILKEYHWSAYEAYLDENGEELVRKNGSVAAIWLLTNKSELRIKHGAYKGKSAVSVLRTATDWVEERIVTAAERAGFDLEERVHFLSWSRMPKVEIPEAILTAAKNPDSQRNE